MRRQALERQTEARQQQDRLRGDLQLVSEQLRQAALDQQQPQRLATLHEEIQRLQAAIQAAEQSQQELIDVSAAEIERQLREFDGIWDALRLSEQQRVLRLLIQQIEFDGAGGEIAITFTTTGHELLEAAHHDPDCKEVSH